MAYSDFNLSELEEVFPISIIEEQEAFRDIKSIDSSDFLKENLKRHLSLALAINTEKARSEFIIAPILSEIKYLLEDQVSLFSGVEFDVDKTQGLNGFCDYILCQDKEQLYIKAPVTVIIEAKKENLNAAIPQCIAAMLGAQQFNLHKNQQIRQIFGVVTLGNLWKFLRLENQTVIVDLQEYYVIPVEQILGILVYMLTANLELAAV
ncbi:MAG TPA: hypothetical protein DCF68_01750 [Cyanothece sp. UBA12306]|nr:hypothetical protein [Cyanothece sp. UBA12306]